MAGNKNSGRKPCKRIILDYGTYIQLCLDHGFDRRTKLSRAMGTSNSNLARWEEIGWPEKQHQLFLDTLEKGCKE